MTKQTRCWAVAIGKGSAVEANYKIQCRIKRQRRQLCVISIFKYIAQKEQKLFNKQQLLQLSFSLFHSLSISVSLCR